MMTQTDSYLSENVSQSNLTNYQLLMWLGQQQNPDVPLYNMVQTFTFHSSIDVDRFQRAFQRLVMEADAMRTVVIERDGMPHRLVLGTPPAELEWVRFDHLADPQAAYDSWLQDRLTHVFTLDACLYDSALVQLSADRVVWYLSQHHIIADAAGFHVLYNRMADLYSHLDTPSQPAPATAFADYVAYEQAHQQTDAFAEAVAYWRDAVPTDTEALDFYGRQGYAKRPTMKRSTLHLGAARSTRLRDLAATRGFRSLTADLSVMNLLLAIYAVWLARVTGAQRVPIGLPLQNRATASFQATPGLFIEMGVITVDIDQNHALRDLVPEIANRTFAALQYVQPGITDVQRSRQYEVVLNFINLTYPDFGEIPVSVDWLHTGYADSEHTLRLQVTDLNGTGEYTLHFDLNRSVFDDHTSEMAVDHFLRVIDTLLHNPDTPIYRCNLLSSVEEHQFLSTFNATDTPFPQHETVVSMFDAQVDATPHHTALRFGEKTLSYAQLQQQSKQVAAALRTAGIGPASVVAVCIGHTAEMLPALLGVLRAGAAYVPLSPRDPDQRLHDILSDIAVGNNALRLLTHSDLKARFSEMDIPTDAIDDILAEAPSAASSALSALSAPMKNRLQPQPDDVAYIMYTSGSTGKPKGAIIDHRGLLNYLWWAKDQYTDGQPTSFPLYSSLAFDLTVTSLYVPLLTGGEVVVYTEATDNKGMVIIDVFADDRVDVVKLTPAHLALLNNADLKLSRIKRLILGGEDLKTSLVRDFRARYGGQIEIYNEYGPTEAVVGSMVHRYDPLSDTHGSVPIGKPGANKRIYLLDAYQTPVPTGVIGELYIGGVGIAQAYLNRPALTTERFLPNPFESGTTMYRTGDLARWLPDGTLQFLGRRDAQVKVGSARIELGEVESALLAHPSIAQCTVQVVERRTPGIASEPTAHCTRCGLPTTYPNVSFDEMGVCNLCRDFDTYRDKVAAFFRPYDDLIEIAEQAKATRSGEYDALVLVSGGKDSTYMLYQLVGMGLKVLAFTLDNGYISDQAKGNLARVVEHLGIDHIYGETPAMHAIFVDSLRRFSNVCNGCFKTIYTLSMKLAHEQGIRYIFTGLSRGQFFETRLSSDVFLNDVFAPQQFDQAIIEARKVYHRLPDAVNQHIDTTLFEDDTIFEQIHIVDFYRYSQVGLAEIYDFMEANTPWHRPSDTGRSTNCTINDIGIYIHRKRMGYHNYALPYSWDVRLGHKTRAAAMAELDDEIDEDFVADVLAEIGYTADDDAVSETRLAAYYVSTRQITTGDLRAHMATTVPDYMIPDHFIQLDELPLTTNGKIDRQALPLPGNERPNLDAAYMPPTTDTEVVLARIWSDVLGIERIGIHDNFFEVGGNSMTNFQVIARARRVGIALKANEVFKHQTIAKLAAVARRVEDSADADVHITGPVPLTPIQHWFFERQVANPSHWNQTMSLSLEPDWDHDALRDAFAAVIDHHDMLRARFTQTDATWDQTIQREGVQPTLDVIVEPLAPATEAIQTRLNIEEGRLLEAVVVVDEAEKPPTLVITVHHLAIDALSWGPLLEDLHTAYEQSRLGEAIQLPPKTTSYRQWAATLQRTADDLATQAPRDRAVAPSLPYDHADGANLVSTSAVVLAGLAPHETDHLLRDAHRAYNTSTNDLLLAALGQTLTEWAGRETVVVDVEGHGREDIDETLDLSRTVGWFTSLHPVVLRHYDDPGEAIRQTKEMLHTAPYNGLAHGVRRYLTTPEAQAATTSAEVLFNFLGASHPGDAGLAWFADMSPLMLSRSPAGKRPYSLEVNITIADRALAVEWTYSPSLHNTTTVERLANRLSVHLRALIAHCTEQASVQFTPSDFADAHLAQDDLDDIFAEFGED